MSEQNSFVSDPLRMFYDLLSQQFVISEQTAEILYHSLNLLQDVIDHHKHMLGRTHA